MKIEREKVLGSAAAGDRRGRNYWNFGKNDEDVDYEAIFRAFMEKLFANRGSFKVDGSLLFEFLPKAAIRNEKLISPETSFYFHQFQEVDENRYNNDNYKKMAVKNYIYQSDVKLLPLRGKLMEEFVPVI